LSFLVLGSCILCHVAFSRLLCASICLFIPKVFLSSSISSFSWNSTCFVTHFMSFLKTLLKFMLCLVILTNLSSTDVHQHFVICCSFHDIEVGKLNWKIYFSFWCCLFFYWWFFF
jgi:hypothetical protein